MGEFLITLFGWLVPPSGADAKQVRRWRVTVAMMTMANSAGLAVFGLVAFGFVPAVFQGFAPRSDLKDTADRLTLVQRYQLDSKIMDTRTRQCRLINQPTALKSQDAVLFATARLQGELEAWLRLTSNPYRLPACEEI